MPRSASRRPGCTQDRQPSALRITAGSQCGETIRRPPAAFTSATSAAVVTVPAPISARSAKARDSVAIDRSGSGELSGTSIIVNSAATSTVPIASSSPRASWRAGSQPGGSARVRLPDRASRHSSGHAGLQSSGWQQPGHLRDPQMPGADAIRRRRRRSRCRTARRHDRTARPDLAADQNRALTRPQLHGCELPADHEAGQIVGGVAIGEPAHQAERAHREQPVQPLARRRRLPGGV